MKTPLGNNAAIGIACFALGVLIGRAVPYRGESASELREQRRITEIKTAVLQHVAKATKEFAPASDVDVVIEMMDRQPSGKVMVVGFCRLVTPNAGGINGGRFWVEVLPREIGDGCEVKDIASKYGVTEDGAPWGE